MKTVLTGIGLVYSIFAFAANDIANVEYPRDYRKWFHVKSTLIGSQHASFSTNGGIHHFYANQPALEGYKTGKFPDGSVLIDDLLEFTDNAGVSTEGARRRVAVMVKDASRFSATGGWGFEVFRSDNDTPTLKADGKAACFACHSKQKDHDSVFSLIRK